MIVVAILGIVLAIAGSTWMRQRQLSQWRACQENLAKIDGAKEQWAMDNNKGDADTPTWANLLMADGSGYLKRQPVCPGAGTYTIGNMMESAACSITEPSNHNEK